MVVIKRTDTLYQFWNALCYFATICSFVTKTVWSRAACRTHSAWFVSSFFFSSSLKTPAAPQPPLMPPLLLSVTLSPPFCPVYGHLSCQSHEPHLPRALPSASLIIYSFHLFLFFIITSSSRVINWPELRAKCHLMCLKWCLKWGRRGEISLFSLTFDMFRKVSY